MADGVKIDFQAPGRARDGGDLVLFVGEDMKLPEGAAAAAGGDVADVVAKAAAGLQ